MSVSLHIRWVDGRVDWLPLAGQRTATEVWNKTGQDLGLLWISHIADWIPVNAENLDALIEELTVFRRAIAESDAEWKSAVLEDADRLREWLLKLKQSTGWEASIG
jgi:hypothetical protein